MKPELVALQYALAKLYPFREQAYTIASNAGINTSFVDFSGQPIVFWNSIITRAENEENEILLATEILKQHPKLPEALAIIHKVKIVQAPILGTWYDISTSTTTIGHNTESNNYEKIMQSQSTLLPISFLEKGVLKAKSVCRIKVNGEVGTGFLIKNNLIVTNNHVIDTETKAHDALIQFNYEETLSGGILEPINFKLDSPSYFKTSIQYDFTIVKVMGNANEKFGALEILPKKANRDDFVNIIQHPAGELKQIALYHNVVTYSDDNIVQYLTDTRPGSSGSPVFNSNWEVVALHHSGGWLQQPGLNSLVFRNEGIAVSRIIEALNN